jgi:predicted GNAT family acetyltransferase
MAREIHVSAHSNRYELSVEDNVGEQRYEARLGSEVVGFLAYRHDPAVMTLIHTEVDPALEGKSIASQLVAGAIGDISSPRPLRLPVSRRRGRLLAYPARSAGTTSVATRSACSSASGPSSMKLNAEKPRATNSRKRSTTASAGPATTSGS